MTFVDPGDKATIAAVDKIDGKHASKEEYERHEMDLFYKRGVVVGQPIKADCLTTFTAVHDSGMRPLSVIELIVIHDEEADTARSAASWFANPASQGSAHIAVDDKTCYRCMDNNRIPWGAPGANYRGFHIEQAGYASWSTAVWKVKHINTIRRCAYKAALHCHRFGIPPVWLTLSELQNGNAGITDHASCTKVFGGTHTDPGPNYPRAMFMWLVHRYFKTLAS